MKGLFDERNLALWNLLKASEQIEIVEGEYSEYSVFTKGTQSTIYVQKDNLNSASFTHELLHIYLSSKRVFISAGLKLSINSSELLAPFLTEDLINHVGNCLEHIKMLPIFTVLGYSEDEFISDYPVNKFTDHELGAIKLSFVNSINGKIIYSALAIDAFIGKFFAVQACNNRSHFNNYKLKMAELKTLDSDLYSILFTFYNEWDSFDYNNTSLIDGDYNLFLFSFIDNLEKWANDKLIV